MLTLEEHSIDIEYILDKKDMAVDDLLQLHNNGTQKSTHKWVYTPETLLIDYDTKEVPEGMFNFFKN